MTTIIFQAHVSPVFSLMLLTANIWLILYLDFTDNLKVTPLGWENVCSITKTWVHARWWVFMLFCLFVCLSVRGGFASACLSICIYCLDNSPQGILSYPVAPSHSQPSQQTAVVEPLSLSDMPEQRWQRAPLGGCYDITGCLGDSLVAAPLCSALTRFNSSYGSSEN